MRVRRVRSARNRRWAQRSPTTLRSSASEAAQWGCFEHPSGPVGQCSALPSRDPLRGGVSSTSRFSNWKCTWYVAHLRSFNSDGTVRIHKARTLRKCAAPQRIHHSEPQQLSSPQYTHQNSVRIPQAVCRCEWHSKPNVLQFQYRMALLVQYPTKQKQLLVYTADISTIAVHGLHGCKRSKYASATLGNGSDIASQAHTVCFVPGRRSGSSQKFFHNPGAFWQTTLAIVLHTNSAKVKSSMPKFEKTRSRTSSGSDGQRLRLRNPPNVWVSSLQYH